MERPVSAVDDRMCRSAAGDDVSTISGLLEVSPSGTLDDQISFEIVAESAYLTQGNSLMGVSW